MKKVTKKNAYEAILNISKRISAISGYKEIGDRLYNNIINNTQGKIIKTSVWLYEKPSSTTMKLDNSVIGFETALKYLDDTLEVITWMSEQCWITDPTVMMIAIHQMNKTSGFGIGKAGKLISLFNGECTKTDSVNLRILSSVFVEGYVSDMDNPKHSDSGHTIHSNLEYFITAADKLGLARPNSKEHPSFKQLKDIMDSYIGAGLVSKGNNFLTFSQYAKIESNVAKLASEQCSLTMPAIEYGVDSKIAKKLTDHQMHIYNSIKADSGLISILLGAAGTGKSQVEAEAVRVGLDNGMSVLVVTPTAKAAMEITSKLEEAGVNVNKLINSRVCTIDSAINSYSRLPSEIDLLLMDEASMASTEHFAILSATKFGKIILAGDCNQLPPVGAGNPFADLVQDHGSTVNAFHLTVQMRSKSKEVDELCTEVLHGDSIRYTVGRVFPFYGSNNNANLRWTLDETYEVNKDESALWNVDNGADIDLVNSLIKYLRLNADALFVTHENKLVDAINFAILKIKTGQDYTEVKHAVKKLIQAFSNYGEAEEIDFSKYVGVTVYWDGDGFKPSCSDDYKIVRGSTGTILPNGMVKIEALKYSNDQTILPKTTFDVNLNEFTAKSVLNDRLRLAYASTVHKAQGSSVSKVIYIPKSRFQGIDRKLAYVAVSRAINHIEVMSLNASHSTPLYNPTTRRTLLAKLLAEK